jgi:hypothetical protein
VRSCPGKDIAYWSQTDITIKNPQTLVDIAQQVERMAGLDFSIAFTRYDVFCAVHMRATHEFAGDFDNFFNAGYYGTCPDAQVMPVHRLAVKNRF